jgi:hypothetical protein
MSGLDVVHVRLTNLADQVNGSAVRKRVTWLPLLPATVAPGMHEATRAGGDGIVISSRIEVIPQDYL